MQAMRRPGSTDITLSAPTLPLPAPSASPGISSSQIALVLERHTLVIPPFQLKRGRPTFLHRAELRIDLRTIEPDLYRVHAVQDFWSEDDNPDLTQCIAGIFLARRREIGTWEEPERWPTECRLLAVLAIVDTRASPYRLAPPAAWHRE
jgi:hypothetical protein